LEGRDVNEIHLTLELLGTLVAVAELGLDLKVVVLLEVGEELLVEHLDLHNS
jgi:hypothetical protein